MAATKEAIAIILDVGPAMNQAPPGDPTDLQTSLTAIKMILQRKMFSESKDEIALVLFGTPDTANDLAGDGESYENITVAKPLSMVSWELLQYLDNDVQPSTTSADFLDAMVVGMDHVMKGIQGKRGFASKRLILFSNLGGEFGDDQLDDIIGSMKEAEIELSIIGPDLDNDDDGGNGGAGDGGASNAANGHVKERTPQQRAGEALLKHVMQHVESDSYSFAEALPALSYFQSRQTRSVAWRCNMEIGENLQVPIMLYNRIKEAKPKTFKNVYAKDEEAELERARTYHLNDEEETEVDASDVVDGHRYGSTLVPFSSDDKEAMKFRAEKCFKILGFTKQEHVRRHRFLGDATWTCIAEKGDDSAAVAMSALINALYETGFVAIVRRVYSNASGVKLGCLQPHIKSNKEYLIYNELPFSEDLRYFQFGALPIKDDNAAANQKLAPSDEQLNLMDDLIDNMDLSKCGDGDDDDDDEEALKPKLTFNPYLQRLYQCLQHRALNPDDPLPDLSSVVANYLKPPEQVMTRCESVVDKMKSKFKLEVVEKKKSDETGDAMFKDKDDTDAPPAKKQKTDDDDIAGGMADLVKDKVTEVGTVSPVEDFLALLKDKEEDKFEPACKMMQKRIVQLVTDSFGTQLYGKALDCLKAYREQAIKNSEPKMFNDFITELKGSIRKDFWQQVTDEEVSLISKMECEESGVTTDEAKKFLAGEEKKEEVKKEEEDVDEDDLLDDLE